MSKTKYFEAVEPFATWVVENLYGDQFTHQYIDRRTKQTMSFASLYDAYAKYGWQHNGIARLKVRAGKDFESNAKALRALRDDLVKAIKDGGTDEDACVAAIDVMKWGGVVHGNVRWLNAHASGLRRRLIETRDALNIDTCQDIKNVADLRFNAGMTKVYSLIADEFIIYDSRVAAALGWLVKKYVNAGHAIVPELLFPWAPAKNAPQSKNPKNRNPGQDGLTFTRLQAGYKHAEWNLKASWLLQKLVQEDRKNAGRFSKTDEPLRALESALFMIGYDIPLEDNLAQQTASEPADQIATGVGHPPAEPWIECFTLSKHNQFFYRTTDESIEIFEGQSFNYDLINATLSWLEDQFGSGVPFPLQNSATAVADGTARPGLGIAYRNSGGKNAPDTSRLAAILEDCHVLIRSNVPDRGVHWTISPAILDGSFDIRAMLVDEVYGG